MEGQALRTTNTTAIIDINYMEIFYRSAVARPVLTESGNPILTS